MPASPGSNRRLGLGAESADEVKRNIQEGRCEYFICPAELGAVVALRAVYPRELVPFLSKKMFPAGPRAEEVRDLFERRDYRYVGKLYVLDEYQDEGLASELGQAMLDQVPKELPLVALALLFKAEDFGKIGSPDWVGPSYGNVNVASHVLHEKEGFDFGGIIGDFLPDHNSEGERDRGAISSVLVNFREDGYQPPRPSYEPHDLARWLAARALHRRFLYPAVAMYQPKEALPALEAR